MQDKENLYNWKRYWKLISKESTNISDMYSFDNYDNYDKNTKQLNEIRNEKCLILLGDAALGKSTCLRQEEQELRKENKSVLLIDLKNISGEHWLYEQFKKLETLTRKNKEVYFLVDSFDEGQISFNNLVNSFVERLKESDIQKIYLRITCRTVVFPQLLLDELQTISIKYRKIKNLHNDFIYQKEELAYDSNEKEKLNVKVYKLQPLSKSDINEVLDCKKINKDIFYNSVPLSDELQTPITALYVISHYSEITNLSQYEIYERICLQLCDKYNGPSNKQILNNVERLNIASTLFSLMLFSNKYQLSIDESSYNNNENILYLKNYFKDLKTVADILKFSLPTNNIIEVLNTGLFTATENKVTCIQKTYLEFLVAKFILENKLYTSFKNLMFDEYNKILPAFSNTICWLAEKDDTIFNEIMKYDPNILLTSMVKYSSNWKNELLLKKTFEISKSDIYGFTSFEQIFKKLKTSKEFIISFIEAYLYSQDSFLVSLSIRLLEINNIIEYNKQIFNISISSNYSSSCRIHALYFLEQFDKDKFSNIRKYIDNFIVDNIKETSRYAYTLINLQIFNYLSEQQFSKLISQNFDDTFYFHTEAEIIVQNSTYCKILINVLIQNFLENIRGENNAIQSLLKHLIELLPFEINDLQFFSSLLYTTMNNPYFYLVHDVLSQKVNNLPLKEKHMLISYYFDNYLSKFHSKHIHPNISLFTPKDAFFLFKYLIKTKDSNFKDFLFFTFRNNSSFNFIIVTYNKIKQLRKDIFSVIQNRKLTYDEYLLMDYIDNLRIIVKKVKQNFQTFKFFITKNRPIDRIRKVLNKDFYICTDWNNAIYYLSFIKNNKNKGFSICPLNIESTEEFSFLNKFERSKLFDLAKYYIQNKKYNEFEIKEWLTTTSFKPFMEMLIAPAMYLTYKNDIDFLRNLTLNSNLVDKCLPYILNYPNDNKFYDTKNCKKELLNYIFEISSENFTNTFSSIIDTLLAIDNPDIYIDFLENLSFIKDEKFYEMLLEKLNILNNVNSYTKTQFDIFNHITEYLSCKKYAKLVDFLKNVIFDEEKPIKLKVSAMRYLGYFNNTYYLYDPILEKDDKIAQAYLKLISRDAYRTSYNNMSNDICKFNFNDSELAQIYNLFETFYPSSEDTYPNGEITERDEISEFKRSIINKCINEGNLQFFEYLNKFKNIEVKDFWVTRAKRNYSIKQYQFITIDALIDLILNTKCRVVLNEKHLFDIVIETLNDLKTNLRNNSTYLRVWNECENNSCFPKNEMALSDEIKRLLLKELNNIIINREVEIQPKIAGEGSHIPDLLVQCKTVDNKTASIIIEVKGCWNAELRSSIRSQLYDRYLCDDNCYKYGIYLIGWYWCDKWDNERKDSKINKIKKENRFSETDIFETEEFFNKRALELSKDDKQIVSIVLDLSIPN